MARVIAPNSQYSGLSASVMFLNGVGETDDEHLLGWFEQRGYTVELLADDEPPAPDKKGK